MGKIKVFEAFAGYGSQSMALKRLGIDFEVVAISEIDKFAIAAYEAINGPTYNVGDISKVRLSQIPDHDLFTYSFPCQDISVAGKQGSLEKGSGTRSSLLWECDRIIRFKRPKYLLLENVKNLVGKKHKAHFDEWLKVLEGYGYKNYWQVINAKDQLIPQNRERVFVVSILGDEDYEFPKKQELKKRLKDVLEPVVDEKYYLSEEIQKRFVYRSGQNSNDIQIAGDINKEDWTDSISRVYDDQGISPTIDTMQGGHRQPKILIKNATKKGYLEAIDGDGIDLNYPDSETRRGRVQPQQAHTITTSGEYGVLENFRIRKLSPLECWRLMDASDRDFYKVKNAGISDSRLYQLAGNSIVVNVLVEIFREMFKETDYVKKKITE